MLPDLVCPACRHPLQHSANRYRCRSCPRSFPVVAGIPDLRLRGDRYLSLEEDRAKAEKLAELDGDLERLLHVYWEMTPEVPVVLAERYIARALDGERRGRVHLQEVSDPHGALHPAGARLLDVGCGTGGLVAAAARAGARAVGVDIALRWLVVAQRYLQDEGLRADLVAADGAVLPFRSGTFDVVTCIETLEHTTDQRGLLHACLSSAAPEGRVSVVTANRFSLAPEPTVGLWGVGFLPRRIAVGYVALRRRTRYEHFLAASATQLRAFLGPDPAAAVRPALLPAGPPGEAAPVRIARRAYDAACRSRVFTPLLTLVAPYLEVHRRAATRP